jgi:hypothetical protein
MHLQKGCHRGAGCDKEEGAWRLGDFAQLGGERILHSSFFELSLVDCG